ncbi:hypothetical protein COLO4_25246 [Corchorus olitorius]|uniref:RNase H type-1 domain-containing protein n=1 Tax=Corchorus olitorius TaxID=93759 RepID=A0A1R3I440_9ROSI|nr:hypothetical protein COLO4_25246 [Corchorus olitorius]
MTVVFSSRIEGIGVNAITWEPPSNGTLKINTDAAYEASRNCASLAAVMRDSNGRVVCSAVDCKSFVKDSLYAEMFAIRSGVRLARNEGI